MYKKLFLLFSISLLANASSIKKNVSDVDVYRENDEIKIAAFDCMQIQGEVDNIKKWSKKTINKIKNDECICNDGYCSMNIKNVLPDIVKFYQDKRPDVNGPNCWNSTLVTAGILPHHRYSTPEEMKFWMNSPLCKEKKINEKLMPGDVIAIREKNSEYHGFVYVSDKLAWSKNGFSKRAKYKTQGLKDVYDLYGVSPECQRVESGSSDCQKYANIYKCEPWDEYWSKVDEATKAKVDEDIERSLNHVECNLSEALNDSSTIDKQLVDLLENTILILEFNVLDLKNALTSSSSNDEKLYIDRATHRILSIKAQLEFLRDRT